MKRIFPLVALLCLYPAMSALACVGCRQPEVNALDEPQTVMAGVAFSWSVVSLLVMVLLIAGGLTAYIARVCQQVDLRESDQ